MRKVIYLFFSFIFVNQCFASDRFDLWNITRFNVWESEYSQHMDSISKIEETEYDTNDKSVRLQEMVFDAANNQIKNVFFDFASQNKSKRELYFSVEKFDKINRLIYRKWKLTKSEYEIRFLYLGNGVLPDEIIYFDKNFGTVYVEKLISTGESVEIKRQILLERYFNFTFDLSPRIKVNYDSYGRKDSEIVSILTSKNVLDVESGKYKFVDVKVPGKIEYEYFENSGSIEFAKFYLPIGEDGYFSAEGTYEIWGERTYDIKGRMLSKKEYNDQPDGCAIQEKGITGIYEYSYVLDKKGNWIEKTEKSYNCFNESSVRKFRRKIVYRQ